MSLLILGLGGTTTAATVQVGANKDNTLYESGTGALSNGAGDYLFAGKTASASSFLLRRAVLSFNVAASVPAGATITSVALTLNMSKAISLAEPVTLHRVSSDWGEGTSNAPSEEGGGTVSTTNDATWTHRFFSSQSWTAPGGDFVAAPSATQSVDQPGFYTWGSPQMLADVQAWKAAPASNYGWLIKGNEASNGSAKRFDSRENVLPANRPVLSVTYTLPGAAAAQDWEIY